MADTDQTKQPNGVQAAYSIADKLTPEHVKENYVTLLNQARVIAKNTASLALSKAEVPLDTISKIIDATEQSGRYGALVVGFSGQIMPIVEDMRKAYAKIDELSKQVESVYAMEVDQKAREAQLSELEKKLNIRENKLAMNEQAIRDAAKITADIEHDTKRKVHGEDTAQLSEMAKQLANEEGRLYKLRQELDKREHVVRDGVTRARQYVAEIKQYIAEKHDEIVAEREEVLEQRLAQKQELQDIVAQGKTLMNDYIAAAITRAKSVEGGERLQQELLASQPDITQEITKLFAVGTIKLTQLGDVAPVETTRYKNLTTQLDDVHNFLLANTDNPTLLEMSPPVEKKPAQEAQPAKKPTEKKMNPNETVIFTPIDAPTPTPPQNP